MNLLHNDSPAGRAIELVNDLVKQGRMSQAEARVIEDLVWNPEFPQALRAPHAFIQSFTSPAARKSWFAQHQAPTYTDSGTGDAPLVPRRPIDAAQ